MEIKPIRSDEAHEEAVREIERLWDAEDGTPEADRLEILTVMVDAWEREHIHFDDPHPIDLLRFVMAQNGLKEVDLMPYIGSRSKVSEVLNRRRALSIEMIRNLSEGLKIPSNLLVPRYELLPHKHRPVANAFSSPIAHRRSKAANH